MSEATAAAPLSPRASWAGPEMAVLAARFGDSYRWMVTIPAMIGTIATILSSTISNVALPEIMGAYGMGQDHAQLVSTAFLASVTGTMLLNGWLVDRFGFRLTYSAAMLIFVFGSLLSGFAPEEGMLILGRVMQGAAAGMVQPLGMQIIFMVYPPEKRGSAMGLYAVGVVLAPALGPAFGGLLVDGFGWRSVFFLAIPFALIGLALGLILMPGPAREGGKRRFDAPGFVLLITALFALLTGLSSGQREGWQSDAVVTELSIAAAAAIAFVWWELRSPAAMLNPRLFAVRGFACSALVALVYGATLFGSVYLLPLFVQTVQGYSATRAGLVLMPAGLALLLVFPIAGRIADKTQPWLPIGIGLVLFAYSTWLMVDVGTDTPFWTLAMWILIGRIGFGIAMPSMNAGALRSLPPQWVGQGSGAINFARQFGGAMGVNLLSIYLERHTQLYAQALTATQEGRGNTADWLRDAERLLAQEGFADGIRQALAQDYLGRVVLTQANMLAFRDTFTVLVLICVLALGVVAVMRGAKRPG